MAFKKRALLGLVCAVMLPTAHGWAQEPAQKYDERLILAKIKAISADPGARAIALAKGRDRVSLCMHCHGEDGNSTRKDIPNLAGQNPTYLIEQIDKFADGRRKNFVMQALAADFTLDDKVNLAIYFSSFEPKPIHGDERLIGTGKRLFSNVCQFCHGADGRGEAGYARLAGQKPVYVQETLKRFRANANKRTDAADIQRTNPRMEQVTQKLTDDDIEALSEYISQMD